MAEIPCGVDTQGAMTAGADRTCRTGTADRPEDVTMRIAFDVAETTMKQRNLFYRNKIRVFTG
ncbi:hypothetical protein [Nocardia sp. NPDC060249]|uniref:hypothetical protein n=1 Tax=Nocardia sp. NPDC060249 TaxID=3347082 RepID=UPI00365C1D6D